MELRGERTMYEIRPESITTFIEDRRIKLPRFQRKQTWDEKQNFELVISIFKNFPLGVVVINGEREGDRYVKWLLDGRQRRNVFLKMQSDPEMVYIWAQKYLNIKQNDQPEEIKTKFWTILDKYLGEEEEEEDEERRRRHSQPL